MLSPSDWNVVVVGQWNRAILTPSGISQRVFGLESGTPVEVLVPIDKYGPYLVKYKGISVIAGSDRLVVSPDSFRYDELERVKRFAITGLTSLPETPITAVGVNIRFRTSDTMEQLLRVTSHDSDVALSDAGFEIAARLHRRTIAWNDGHINVTVEQEHDGQWTVLFNFERVVSDADQARAWLETPIASFQDAVILLLQDYLHIDSMDIEHDEPTPAADIAQPV